MRYFVVQYIMKKIVEIYTSQKSKRLLIICVVNQRPVSKSMFVNLITVLSSTCFHYPCAASLILTSKVPGVTRVTIGIGQRRVRPFNDIVLLVCGRSLVTGVPSIYLLVSMSSEFNVNVSTGIIFTICDIKIVWLYHIV